MQRYLKILTIMIVLTPCSTTLFAATRYLVTNDENEAGNTATIYSIRQGGQLTLIATIPIPANGVNGAFFAGEQKSILRSKTENCLFLGDAIGQDLVPPGDVAAIDMNTLTLVGTFPGSPQDSGLLSGVGLAESSSAKFLFASYTASKTLATYVQMPGCKLQFVSEISAIGLHNGVVDGMRVTPDSKTLVVAYGDGSIGSYHINSKTGALSLVSRRVTQDDEDGVDITADGKWAIFGDAAVHSTVSVAPIRADGSLGVLKNYAVGKGESAQNVWLSPDETLLYVGDNFSGTISAAPFNKLTGVVDSAHSCTSPVLSGFNSAWVSLGTVGGGPTGSGSPLYVAEEGDIASIGIVNVTKPCTLTEAKGSPVSDPNSSLLVTIGEDPPRAF